MKLLRILILLFLVSFGATVFLTQAALQPENTPVRIEIASGKSVRDIAATLKRHGIIRSATVFRLYLKSRGIDRSIRSGTFLIEPGMSFAEIAQMLSEGREAVVTIPEGYTLTQIDALLALKGLGVEGGLLACAEECDFSAFEFLPEDRSSLEGYLFPDTYYVNVSDFVPAAFLGRMLETFRERVVAGLADDLAESGRSLGDVVIMASLIERETNTSAERAVVAGILWKRLGAARGLDVDATIRYALNKSDGPLTKEDLRFDSPYNTRRYRGLPPGPIANPGLASIEAALRPEDSPYWYYLHGRDGRIRYAETNEEHNANKARYL